MADAHLDMAQSGRFYSDVLPYFARRRNKSLLCHFRGTAEAYATASWWER